MVPQEDHTGIFVYCFYKVSLSNRWQRFVLIINRFQQMSETNQIIVGVVKVRRQGR